MTGKFIGYFRLVDACALSGCPVCRCVDEDGRRHLDAIMYEQVNDPDTRRRLRASWGFCNWHAWMLLEIPNAASGAAIVYEDLVGGVLRRARRVGARPARAAGAWRRWLRGAARVPVLLRLYRRRRPCPVCAWSAGAEAGYVEILLRFADDPQFARAYAGSDGICVPHLLDALERGARGEGFARLLDGTLAKWEALRADLGRFVAKHDYRNAAAFSDSEVSACRRAFETLSGRRGVFVNDRRRANGPAARVPETPPAAGLGAADPAFELGKLELRVRELTAQLNESMSRAAALHYRLSQVAEDRNALELNLSGERGANALAMRTIEDLRAENARLRAELAARDAVARRPS